MPDCQGTEVKLRICTAAVEHKSARAAQFSRFRRAASSLMSITHVEACGRDCHSGILCFLRQQRFVFLYAEGNCEAIFCWVACLVGGVISFLLLSKSATQKFGILLDQWLVAQCMTGMCVSNFAIMLQSGGRGCQWVTHSVEPCSCLCLLPCVVCVVSFFVCLFAGLLLGCLLVACCCISLCAKG